MTQNTARILNLFGDEDRARALIKYELNYLKSSLRCCVKNSLDLSKEAEKIVVLCSTIANRYMDYLHLLDKTMDVQLTPSSWHPDHFAVILNLEHQLTYALTVETKKNLIVELVSLYKMIQTTDSLVVMQQISGHAKQLKHLFTKAHLDNWLDGFVDFCNKYEPSSVRYTVLFHDWSVRQQQRALDFFSQTKFVDLANAIFFYKLHPDKLFTQLMHPEKLVSVRIRLGVLHYYVELLQQQLHSASLHKGLIPPVDHLLHGNTLPQGIMLEVDERFRKLIQIAIKKLKITSVSQNSQPEAVEVLYDLGRAYKFWFNPNRLIDAVMVLQQNLVSEAAEKQHFQQEVVRLFGQLATTECLDLYGYFANHDTCDLLLTFSIIAQGEVFDWLPAINETEKTTIKEVLQTLMQVMEALRIELNNRHVITEPYDYETVKENILIGQPNRDAVLRTMTIYGQQTISPDDNLEQWFRLVEETM